MKIMEFLDLDISRFKSMLRNFFWTKTLLNPLRFSFLSCRIQVITSASQA